MVRFDSHYQNAGKPADWISDGEKYALIGLSVKIEHSIAFQEMKPGLWIWTDQALEVPVQWREWIGSIRTEEIENCNLVLLSKMLSVNLDVLNDENRLL